MFFKTSKYKGKSNCPFYLMEEKWTGPPGSAMRAPTAIIRGSRMSSHKIYRSMDKIGHGRDALCTKDKSGARADQGEL